MDSSSQPLWAGIWSYELHLNANSLYDSVFPDCVAAGMGSQAADQGSNVSTADSPILDFPEQDFGSLPYLSDLLELPDSN